MVLPLPIFQIRKTIKRREHQKPSSNFYQIRQIYQNVNMQKTFFLRTFILFQGLQYLHCGDKQTYFWVCPGGLITFWNWEPYQVTYHFKGRVSLV